MAVAMRGSCSLRDASSKNRHVLRRSVRSCSGVMPSRMHDGSSTSDVVIVVSLALVVPDVVDNGGGF